MLPAKELVRARTQSKRILSAVDGAHVPGMMRLNIHDLGCDMYSASPHKWLLAPKGSGFLYVRDEVIDRLWNTIVTEGWDEPQIRAERFQRIGSSNVPALWGLARVDQTGERHRHRPHRTPASCHLADYMLAEMRSGARNRGPRPIPLCAAPSSA